MPLAAEALAALAERATRVYMPDLAPRRQPPALIDTFIASVSSISANAGARHTIADAQEHGRVLVFDRIERTERVHQILNDLVVAVQARPQQADALLEAAHARLQAALGT